MKRSTRCTCVMLLYVWAYQVESYRVESFYDPRSQSLDGLKQQRLSKDIDEQIKTLKAKAGEQHITEEPRTQHKRSNTISATNPHVRHLNELLNGTAMANVSLNSKMYHMTKNEKKFFKNVKERIFPKEHDQKQENFAQHQILSVNHSAPAMQVVQSRQEGLPEQVRALVGTLNATAKELGINISGMTSAHAAVEATQQEKNLTHTQIRKASMKNFGESSNAWRREMQTERAQQLDNSIQKEMEEMKKHSSPIRLEVPKNKTVPFANAAKHMARDVQEVIDASNVTKRNLTNAVSRTNHTNDKNATAKNLRH